MRPDIRAVAINIEGDIPDQLNSLPVAMLFKRKPLREEKILEKLLTFNLVL